MAATLREGHGAQLTARPVPALIGAGVYSANRISYAAARELRKAGTCRFDDVYSAACSLVGLIGDFHRRLHLPLCRGPFGQLDDRIAKRTVSSHRATAALPNGSSEQQFAVELLALEALQGDDVFVTEQVRRPF